MARHGRDDHGQLVVIDVFEATGFAVLYSLMVVGGGLLLLILASKALEKALVVSMGIDALRVVAGRVGMWQRGFRFLAMRRPEKTLREIGERLQIPLQAYRDLSVEQGDALPAEVQAVVRAAFHIDTLVAERPGCPKTPAVGEAATRPIRILPSAYTTCANNDKEMARAARAALNDIRFTKGLSIAEAAEACNISIELYGAIELGYLDYAKAALACLTTIAPQTSEG